MRGGEGRRGGGADRDVGKMREEEEDEGEREARERRGSEE